MLNWTCGECNKTLDNSNNCPEHTHVHAPEKVVCCGKPMSFELMEFSGERKINAVFDWPHQAWRNVKGELIKDEDQGNDWDFACGKCSGPSKMTNCNCYYEYYTCLNCGAESKVN